MIDLRKATLLEEMLRLPYTFIMPAPLFDDEWLSLSTAEKTRLRGLDLEIRDLPGPMVVRAAAYFNRIGGSNSMTASPWCSRRRLRKESS